MRRRQLLLLLPFWQIEAICAADQEMEPRLLLSILKLLCPKSLSQRRLAERRRVAGRAERDEGSQRRTKMKQREKEERLQESVLPLQMLPPCGATRARPEKQASEEEAAGERAELRPRQDLRAEFRPLARRCAGKAPASWPSQHRATTDASTAPKMRNTTKKKKEKGGETCSSASAPSGVSVARVAVAATSVGSGVRRVAFGLMKQSCEGRKPYFFL